ncbi:MAG TPA: RNA polymerase sigma-54 factor, partial [Spirochaetota bacterium]|nr:RNA polymerase sigma-54 factor [Spirochaetota bacterium]
MAVSLQLGLKQNQKLILTQSLKQAIELLQLSTLELADKISEELLNNPVLEEGEQSSSSDIDNANLVSEVSQNLSGDESTLNRAEEELDKYGDMGEAPFSISVEQDKKRDYLESVVAHVESLSEHLMWQAQLT